MKRDGLIVAASLAGALLLALLGYEALRWHDSVAADDARFAASPLSEGLWKHEERLPLAPTRRLLGLSDDLAYRRAVSLYTRSRPGEPTALNPQREALRGNARQALSALSRTDPELSRRSQAAMLIALLSLGQGDLFQSAEERLQVLRGGETVLDAFRVEYTPGHASHIVSSGGKTLFVQADVTNVPFLFVRNPGWHLMFDQDPALAEKTRRRVYDMLVADKMRVQGFHYPFPANGFVEKDGNGYRLIPAPWNPVI